jgi:hypothetical protein
MQAIEIGSGRPEPVQSGSVESQIFASDKGLSAVNII